MEAELQSGFLNEKVLTADDTDSERISAMGRAALPRRQLPQNEHEPAITRDIAPNVSDLGANP
jgi:hypothetical protein